ncbi:MAG TPA: CRTAC1 family protein [Thermoanaerobaculia bacterium]|nr:CRTAC1 family protein [Thermoanaerobaculia bacterium]
MSKRKKRLVLGLTVAPLALGVGVWLAFDAADRSGRDFYAAGRSAVECLDGLAAALGKRDPAAIGRFYSADFAGRDLGLLHPRLVEDKDGVRALRLAAAGGAEDRAGAVAAWQQYLAGFAKLEEVGLHVHRLEKWSSTGDLVASVRFELIGTPRPAPASAPPTIDRAYFRMRFVRGPGGLAIREASLLEGERVSAERPLFRDVAHEAGIDFRNRYYPPFLNQRLAFGMIRYGPGGITAVDYDNDGFYDLFIPDGVSARLLRNRGDGTFEDVTEKAGLGGLDGVSVGVFADYDNDGFKDLFVSRTFRHNQLFHNNGDGTFTDVTARSGLGEDCCTTVASWGDYDNDGFLDLYVGRYLDPRKDIPTTFYARNGTGNRLYHNNGDGTFTDVTAKAGVADKGLCLGSAWGDYDGDGYPDLLVANDFGRSTLFHNKRDGTFDDVTVGSHTLAYGAGMSASWGDYDNDGRLDIYIADIRSEFGWFGAAPTVARYMANSWKQGVWMTDMPLYFQIFRQSGLSFVDVFSEMAAGNHLLRNRGDGTFEDVTWKAGANPVGWFWGSVFADFDNDGWLDIYSADGWVYNKRGTEIELGFLNNVVGRQKDYKTGMFFDPKNFGDQSWHGWERNRHLRNNGDGTFREIGAAAGTDLVTNSRGVAVADFWNRGALDIAVAASDDRHALLRNEVGTRRHWLQVELTGTRSNRDAVGARVSIVAGGKRQLREVALGDGYASQNALRLHFGLGEAPVVEEMTVRWPASGTVQRFRNVAADRIVAVTEGKDELVERHYRPTASAKLPLPASNSKKAASR